MNNTTFIPVQRQGVITQNVDGETLILNKQGTEIHQLNEVASLVWANCDGAHTEEDISEILLQNYAVSDEQAIKDTSEIIASFKEKGLLRSASSKNDV